MTDAERDLLPYFYIDGWRTDLQRRTVNLVEVISGGVPRDGIPPVDNPKFTSVSDAPDWLDPREPVIAFEHRGEARAYPLNILLRHEIVNDVVGGDPVVITYCPLCNSSVAFERTVNGEVLRFGVSGFLRNSDLVMWDNKTESWWQQFTGESIVGDYAGTKLTFLPVNVTSWETFAASFPDGQVLMRPLSFDYERTPYDGYDDPDNKQPFLFFGQPDPRLPAVSRVAAFEIDGLKVAYPFEFIARYTVVNDRIGDTEVAIVFDGLTESAFRSRQKGGKFNVSGSVTAFNRRLGDRTLTFGATEDGAIVDDQTGSRWDRFGKAIEGELKGAQLDPVLHGSHFWFAWASFNPDTEIRDSLDKVVAAS